MIYVDDHGRAARVRGRLHQDRPVPRALPKVGLGADLSTSSSADAPPPPPGFVRRAAGAGDRRHLRHRRRRGPGLRSRSGAEVLVDRRHRLARSRPRAGGAGTRSSASTWRDGAAVTYARRRPSPASTTSSTAPASSAAATSSTRSVFVDVVDINLNGSMRACAAARPPRSVPGGPSSTPPRCWPSSVAALVPAYPRFQGRDRPAHQVPRHRLRPRWHPRERHRPRLDRHASDRSRFGEDPARNDPILARTPMKRWGEPEEVAAGVVFSLTPRQASSPAPCW